jgi:2-phospho-L-lactate guanylyltransferase
MNIAVRLGLDTVKRLGAKTAVVLPGDVPQITVADLEKLLGAAADATRAVVVGASRDGLGTNALLLRPVDVIVPAFGPPSVERHVRAGQHAGAVTRVQRNLGLALDVDTPADLAVLAERPVGRRTATLLAHPALI